MSRESRTNGPPGGPPNGDDRGMPSGPPALPSRSAVSRSVLDPRRSVSTRARRRRARRPHPTPRHDPVAAPYRSPEAAGRWWRSRWILGAVLAVLALILVLENREPTTIRLLIPVVTMPLWVALTMMAVIGLLVGLLLRRR